MYGPVHSIAYRCVAFNVNSVVCVYVFFAKGDPEMCQIGQFSPLIIKVEVALVRVFKYTRNFLWLFVRI